MVFCFVLSYDLCFLSCFFKDRNWHPYMHPPFYTKLYLGIESESLEAA